MIGYIKLSDAIKQIESLQDCYNGFSDTYDKACIIGALEEIPTVDAVPVVRCKNCNRKNVIPDMYGIGTEALYCRAIERYVEHDFFCKYGRR